MATTKTKTKTKAKGKGLTKKVGPFPAYVYLIGVAVVILYLYYRHRNSQSSDAGSQNQQIIPSGIVVPSSQGGSSQDNSGGGGSTDSSPVEFPTDYVTQTDLQSGLDDVKSSTAASIAAITFPQPTINITVPKQQEVHKTTTQSKTAAKKAAIKTPTKFFTYKKNVPLKAGQTLHYTKGKGYYAQ